MEAGGSGSRWGFLGGLAGSILGGFTWILLTGVFLKDAAIWGSGAALALAIWIGGAQWYGRAPQRHLTILGVTIIAIVALDWFYLWLVLPRLPELAASPAYVGITRASLGPLRPILAVASVAGTLLVLLDLWRRKP
jgi:hypothetical protein